MVPSFIRCICIQTLHLTLWNTEIWIHYMSSSLPTTKKVKKETEIAFTPNTSKRTASSTASAQVFFFDELYV